MVAGTQSLRQTVGYWKTGMKTQLYIHNPQETFKLTRNAVLIKTNNYYLTIRSNVCVYIDVQPPLNLLI